MYICMYVNVCMCVYIYIYYLYVCNVFMDGWNGMEWKGREGNGIVDRQLDGSIDMIHVKDSYIQKMPLHRKSHQFLRPPPLAAEPLTHEARCFISSKILGS